MEPLAIVSSCIKCGGWCCKAVSTCEHLCIKKNNESYPFWKPLSLQEASTINPWLPSNLKGISFFSCERLSSEGLCLKYNERPDTCSEYPNLDDNLIDHLDNSELWHVPWCYYRSIILELLGIPFYIMEDGEQCRNHYLSQILDQPELMESYQNPNLLKLQAQKNSKAGME